MDGRFGHMGGHLSITNFKGCLDFDTLEQRRKPNVIHTDMFDV